MKELTLINRPWHKLCCALGLIGILLLTACSGTTQLSPLALPAPAGHQPKHYPSGTETFAQIATQYNLSEAALRRFNPRSQQDPPPRQPALLIPERDADASTDQPYYYRIQPGDTFSALARHFHLSLNSLLQANPGVVPERLHPGQKIIIPAATRHLYSYRWPVNQPRLKLNFATPALNGQQGLALATLPRQEVFPIAPGLVIFAGYIRGLGRVVIVSHTNGQQSIYAYCHALFVEQNAQLSGRHPVCSAGQQRQLGQPGIYFELREAGVNLPPQNYLPALPWTD